MKGQNWRLYIRVNGELQAFAGAREESMSLSPDAIDRTGKERDGYQRVEGGGKRSCSLNVSGVAKRNAAYDELVDAVQYNRNVELVAETFDAVLSGTFHPSGYRETAPNNQSVSFSVSFDSSGVFEYERDAAIAPTFYTALAYVSETDDTLTVRTAPDLPVIEFLDFPPRITIETSDG